MIEQKLRQLEDLQLIEAIADPNTPESVWVPACLSFGEAQIVPNNDVLNEFRENLNNMSAATCAAWSVPIAFMSCEIIIVLILKALTGHAGPWDATHGAGFDTGLRFAFFSAIPFWAKQFQGRTAQMLAYFTMFILLLYVTTLTAPGLPAMLFGMAEFAVLYFLTEKVSAIGEWFRSSTPDFLRKPKLTAAASPMLWLAFYMAIIICMAFISFVPPDLNMFLLPITALLLTVSWPGFVMAQLSKSKALGASGAFGLIMQVPLIVGLLVGASIAGMAAVLCAVPGGIGVLHAILPNNSFDGLQQTVAVSKALLMLDMAFVVGGLSVAGGYFGAWLNRVKASTPKS
jgi:hypothetical protein